jgi:biopolymer transport protein ExbB/TolQ
MYSSERPKTWSAPVAVIFIITESTPAGACVYEEPTVWQTIQRMSVEQLAGTLILFGLLALLVAIAISRGRAIFRAVRQTRAYESRALTALFYNRVEEAVSVCALFPSSPVAAVVTASFQQSHPLPVSAPRCLRPSKPAFQRAVVAQTIALRRWLWILAAIGWSSPVIGLATVLVPSTHFGGGPPLPFCFGLLIAVPAVWLHRGLACEVELLLFETDRMSLSIVDQISDQLPRSD